MQEKLRIPDRRNSVRLKKIYPALYTRFDRQGRPFDEKPSRSVNISVGGMKLESSFPVQPKEKLDIAMALRDRLVTFRGEVVYVIHAQDQTFELGISIREMKNGKRHPLNRLQGQPRNSRVLEEDEVIIRMGQIVCPNCGEQIASVDRIRAMTAYCKEFLGQCSCGLGYQIRISSYGSASLCFPDRQIELVC